MYALKKCAYHVRNQTKREYHVFDEFTYRQYAAL